MSEIELIISFAGGFFAGILNTLAGFGSIITLAIYMDMMGLPGHIANATNRVNVLASSSISTFTFYKKGKLKLGENGWVILTVSIGAITGIILATQLNDTSFKLAFNYLLIPILVVILLNPSRFINTDPAEIPVSRWFLIPILFVLGFYAGFIQVGFGVLFLLVLVILGKKDLIKSNVLKVAIVFIYTIFAIIIFHMQGLINWKAGLALASGQALGGYLAAIYASRFESANKWAYRLLILIVVSVIIKNFGLWKIFI